MGLEQMLTTGHIQRPEFRTQQARRKTDEGVLPLSLEHWYAPICRQKVGRQAIKQCLLILFISVLMVENIKDKELLVLLLMLL